MTEQFFEMLWDCPQCDAQGLLGATHRHCPSCGAAQDPAKRYFPAPGQEIEAKNHRYAGVDWACAYCETPNSAAAAFCGNCGGPKDGTKEVTLVQDKPPGKPPAAPVPGPANLPPPPSAVPDPLQAAQQFQRSPRPGIPWFGILLALLLVAGSVLTYLFLSKHDEGVQITEKSWTRSIDIEHFTVVRDSDWCDAMPPDAYQVSRAREQRSTRQVSDGQDCEVVRSDVGDGTFTTRQECTTRYRSEPVFDTKCQYRINRWRLARSDQLAGGANLVPTWPTPRLSNALVGGNTLGAERLGTRRETYRVKLQSTKGKNWTCHLSATNWSALAERQQLTVKVRVIGGVDCDTLGQQQP
jgi:hypothetical protein